MGFWSIGGHYGPIGAGKKGEYTVMQCGDTVYLNVGRYNRAGGEICDDMVGKWVLTAVMCEGVQLHMIKCAVLGSRSGKISHGCKCTALDSVEGGKGLVRCE